MISIRRAIRDPVFAAAGLARLIWIPAFAGMTIKSHPQNMVNQVLTGAG